MYEHVSQPLLTRVEFLGRWIRHFGWAASLMGLSLGVGMIGYMGFENLDWLDAFLNASMLLGGMGPVDAPQSPGGKLFAGLYALYAGLLFIAVSGLLLAPVFHRIMHRFHRKQDL